MKLNVHYVDGSDSTSKEICQHYWQTGGDINADPFTYKVKSLVQKFNLASSAQLRDIVESNSYASIPGITCIDCKKEIPATTRSKVKILECKGNHACETCAGQRSDKIKVEQELQNETVESSFQENTSEDIVTRARTIQNQNTPSIFALDEYQKALIVIARNGLQVKQNIKDGLNYNEKQCDTKLSPSLYMNRQILKELIDTNILLYRSDSPYQEIKPSTPIEETVPITIKFDLAFSEGQVKAMQSSLKKADFISRLISNELYLQTALDLQAEMVVEAYLSKTAEHVLEPIHEQEVRKLAREFVIQISPSIMVSTLHHIIHSHLDDIGAITTKEQMMALSNKLYNKLQSKLTELSEDGIIERCDKLTDATPTKFKSEASFVLFDSIYGISNAGYNYTCTELIKNKIVRLNKEKDLKSLAALYTSILSEDSKSALS